MTRRFTASEVDAERAKFSVVSLDELKRRHVLGTYAATGSNACLTARLLGISRTGIDRERGAVTFSSGNGKP